MLPHHIASTFWCHKLRHLKRITKNLQQVLESLANEKSVKEIQQNRDRMGDFQGQCCHSRSTTQEERLNSTLWLVRLVVMGLQLWRKQWRRFQLCKYRYNRLCLCCLQVFQVLETQATEDGEQDEGCGMEVPMSPMSTRSPVDQVEATSRSEWV